MKEMTALLLAGGKSSRMGTNKGFLKINNQTFIEKIAKSVSHIRDVYLVVNEAKVYEQMGLSIVLDEYKECGPIGGIHAGLKASRYNSCIVLPCDTPFVDKYIVDYLISQDDDCYDLILPRTSDGKYHPLLAIYHKSALHTIDTAIKNNNYRLLNLIEKLNVKVIDIERKGFNVDNILNNINTKEQYRKITSTPPVIAISGISNSGKTTIMVEIIKQLKAKGYKIGTIKHDAHGFDMDYEGKDTYRHRQAGADGVIITSNGKYAMIQWSEQEVPVETLISYHSHQDIILLEGFKYSSYKKIEIVRKEISQQPVCDQETLLAIATDVNMKLDNIPIISLDNITALVNIIEDYVREYRHDRS
ncbi:MAG: molybdopterin-guanine dinucleotide biosynthesis protein B [Vallitalea sp.]|jgi:molybdopterin-guanine dinucleotide biosynthesis protein MobB|nr:molybdopterin-guanine dinucleotide biosynthesis protein B [Vallitalea sp.]